MVMQKASKLDTGWVLIDFGLICLQNLNTDRLLSLLLRKPENFTILTLIEASLPTFRPSIIEVNDWFLWDDNFWLNLVHFWAVGRDGYVERFPGHIGFLDGVIVINFEGSAEFSLVVLDSDDFKASISYTCKFVEDDWVVWEFYCAV